MLDELDCPTLDFILGEATVSRPVGNGVSVIRAQIQHLKRVAEDPKITLRFMPFAAGVHPGMGTAFTLLEFRDPELRDLVYLENADQDSIERDDTDEVKRYVQRFGTLQQIAAPPEEFAAKLDEVANARFGDV